MSIQETKLSEGIGLEWLNPNYLERGKEEEKDTCVLDKERRENELNFTTRVRIVFHIYFFKYNK